MQRDKRRYIFASQNKTEMEYFIKEGFQLNPNEKVVQAITKRIAICEGNCPCHNTGYDTKCPCSDYREQDECHCKLYIKK